VENVYDIKICVPHRQQKILHWEADWFTAEHRIRAKVACPFHKKQHYFRSQEVHRWGWLCWLKLILWRLDGKEFCGRFRKYVIIKYLTALLAYTSLLFQGVALSVIGQSRLRLLNSFVGQLRCRQRGDKECWVKNSSKNSGLLCNQPFSSSSLVLFADTKEAVFCFEIKPL
jgi:hypothetical protein